MMLRQGVQFHWRNPGYANFNAYLAGMSHDKRKRIKQERRKVREADAESHRLLLRLDLVTANPSSCDIFPLECQINL